MSNEIDNGGPAFPVSEDKAMFPGMTLRDHFAGLALQSVINRLAGSGLLSEEAKGDFLLLAQTAYALADAMLKVRQLK